MFLMSAGGFEASGDGVADARAGVAAAVVAEPGDADLVALLSTMEPGPSVMALLGSIDLDSLDVNGRVEVAAAWERQAAWVAAQAQRSLAAVVADVTGQDSARAREEVEWRCDCVAAALRWSPCTAANRLFTAWRLVGELGPTFELLEAGEISFRHAWLMADAVQELMPDEQEFVQARVLGTASELTVAQFTRSVKRAVLAAAPELAAARRREAMESERGVRVSSRPDGMAVLVATMSATEAHTVYEALDAVARKAKADAEANVRAAAATTPAPASTPITAPALVDSAAIREAVRMDGLRADALLAWANDALANPDVPRRQGRRVELQVVVDLPTLLGMADNPAELVGYGPIPPDVARELAGEASWRRLVVDPVDGHLLDYGSAVYRPPQKLVDFIVARDRRCRFPGCGRRADACDIDHVCAHGKQGGKTAACNCCALCRKHHRAKTTGGWHLQLHDDGSVTWTAPNGRTFHVEPVDQLE